MISFFLGRYVF
jgi:uncharacterized membrane protein YdjX (TVP38/TMEM64 family)